MRSASQTRAAPKWKCCTILERETFDMVVMGKHPPGRVATDVVSAATCTVVTMPHPAAA